MYLTELELLEFSNNEVASLENICKSSLPSLKRLRASNNRIAGPIPVLNLPELELLKLDHNQISDINALAKSAIP
jgi:Leucine-rich repeat (LRR) protein